MDIKDKLAKLLAMANDKRGNEEEANTAMMMAASLAAKHNIDLKSIEGGDTKQAKIVQKRVRDEMTFTQYYAAHAAAALMGIRCYTYDNGKNGFEFTGRDDLIESASDVMLWLLSQIDMIYRGHLAKGLSQRDRAEFRKTFKPACARRVYERAALLMHEMKTNERAAQKATGHNALVVAGYFETLKEEIREFDRIEAKKWELTPEEKAEHARREAAREARHQQWRLDNPKEAAAQDRRDAREQRRWENRKPPKERQMPKGSGSKVGYQAGDRVKLRKEVE